MMKEPVNLHYPVTVRKCSGFSLYTRGIHFTQMRQLWMLSIEDDGKPKRLPASLALLVPAKDSDANASISAATFAERV
ncbi:hypothetical protein NPIL_69101 [Nephila pilipes]|uniref:Uncharacterized protein n=1 Tax=Nephila pilipes TaxID=299642 RepID=A0A8X6NNJ5_NEPPI|nr:hypothetical protein NPIL_69101 [Nephila pilipes]